MLDLSVEEKKLVWREYSKTVCFIRSNGQKVTCPWWENLLLSHVKCHLEENNTFSSSHTPKNKKDNNKVVIPSTTNKIPPRNQNT
jgi:hypothetical protein